MADDNTNPPAQEPTSDQIILSVDKTTSVAPFPIGARGGTIPPSIDAASLAFSKALHRAPEVVDKCTNCGATDHLFRASEEPLRNEDFEVAAKRAKGLIPEDDVTQVPKTSQNTKAEKKDDSAKKV